MSIAKALNEGDKNGYDKIMMNDSSLYGRISAKMVYVYPPGIPILCPGEIISENVVNIISIKTQKMRDVKEHLYA